MNNTRRKALISISLVIMLLITSIVSPNVYTSAKVKVKTFTLSKKKTVLYKGELLQLGVKKVRPSNAMPKLTWKSKNKSVASVSPKGLVKANKKGKTLITAVSKQNKKIKDSCQIIVKNGVVNKSIQLNLNRITLTQGETKKLSIKKWNPKKTSVKKVKWNSGNKNVANVSQNGTITARKEGETTITAINTYGKKATCKVTVNSNSTVTPTITPTVTTTPSPKPTQTPVANVFTIVSEGKVPDIYVEPSDDKQVVRVASDLQKDITSVTEVEPDIKNESSELGENVIIIGTIEKNSMIKKLMEQGKLEEAKEIKGNWESYVIKKVNNPTTGVKEALVIAGSDKRGAIYGTYDISEKIGVSPWYWWADVTPEVKTEITLSGDAKIEGEPSVQYRGIFINDEPSLTNWSKQFKSPNSNTFPNEIMYARVFELMLRLKANTVWPAMHAVSAAFNKTKDTDGKSFNAKTADEYGIVMGTSHCEMLMRNNEGEWDDWVKKNAGKYEFPDSLVTAPSSTLRSYYDFSIAPNALKAYWQESLDANGDFENIYTIGMRGVHDTGFAYNGLQDKSMASQLELVRQIIECQRDMIKEKFGSEDAVPQVYIPYKEAAKYYHNGLEIPDDVTLTWAEDNYGYLRQVPTADELQRKGGSGVYYHVSYYGWPNSYLWLDSMPLSTMYEEMKKAYDTGAKKYWILNVGDIKPAEISTEFFMNLGWNVEKFNDEDIRGYLSEIAKRDFTEDEEIAEEISDIRTEFLQIANAKRAENMGQEGTFSDVYSIINNGDEGQRRIGELDELVNRAEDVYQKLPQGRQDAFYEMIYYAIRATKNSLEMAVYADKNNLYAKQGRYKSVVAYAELAKKAQDQIVEDTKYYNENLADGKWNKIMNPYPGGYPQAWTRAKLLSKLMTVSKAYAEDGIGSVCEGQELGTENVTLSFSSLENNERFIDIFNRGDDPCKWTGTPSSDFIKLSKTSSDNLDIEERIKVTIDWSKLEAGETKEGSIEIKDEYGHSFVHKVAAKKSNLILEENSYAEANGIVAIEAEYFTEKIQGEDGSYWDTARDLGRSGSSMRIYPDDFQNRVDGDFDQTAQLKYRVYFESTGTFKGALYRIPTLNEGSENGVNRTCRVAVGLDSAVPTVLNGVSQTGSESFNGNWARNVMENIEKLSFTIKVDNTGYHDIVVYKSDSGIAFDRIVINTGGEKKSYLGPDTSYNTIHYNKAAIANIPSFSDVTINIDGYKQLELMWFNFGDTNAGSDYTNLRANKKVYEDSVGFGWENQSQVDAIKSQSGTADKVHDKDKSYNYSSTESTFIAKVPKKGKYAVSIASGDISASGRTFQMSVKANGVSKLNNVLVKAGGVNNHAFIADVTSDDLQLKLTFSGNWGLNSIEINPYYEPETVNNTGLFIEEGGSVALEAEAALEMSDSASIREGSYGTWGLDAGYSGMAIYHGPNAGRNFGTDSADAPIASYKIKFNTTGTYRVWILSKALSIEDDSIHVGMDGGILGTYNPSSASKNRFEWVNTNISVTILDTTSPHTLNLAGREDGFLIDKIVLTKNGDTPSGYGRPMKRDGNDIPLEPTPQPTPTPSVEPYTIDLKTIINTTFSDVTGTAVYEGEGTQVTDSDDSTKHWPIVPLPSSIPSGKTVLIELIANRLTDSSPGFRSYLINHEASSKIDANLAAAVVSISSSTASCPDYNTNGNFFTATYQLTSNSNNAKAILFKPTNGQFNFGSRIEFKSIKVTYLP